MLQQGEVLRCTTAIVPPAAAQQQLHTNSATATILPLTRFASDLLDASPRHPASMQRVLSRSKLSALTLHDMIRSSSRSGSTSAGPAAASAPSLTPFAATAAAVIAGAAGDELTGGRPSPARHLRRTTSLEYDDPSDEVFMQVGA